MPTLPGLEVNQAQYDYLIAAFTERAQKAGLPDAAAAYRQFQVDNLVAMVKGREYEQANAEIQAAVAAAQARVAAVLDQLLGTSGAPPSLPVPYIR
jgi:hypothetical protein